MPQLTTTATTYTPLVTATKPTISSLAAVTTSTVASLTKAIASATTTTVNVSSATTVVSTTTLAFALQAKLAATIADLCVPKPAIKTKTLEQNATAATTLKQNVSKKVGSTLQTGIDRDIQIKRKLSPQNSASGNKTKMNRNNLRQRFETQEYTNRFGILVDNDEDLPPALMKGTKRSQSPHLYTEKSSNTFVNKIIELVRKYNFRIIPQKKDSIHETKVQVKRRERRENANGVSRLKL